MPSSPAKHDTSSSRERLLQAAKHLFAARGYEQTATSAIARAARTSESQLMRYFGGKVGLLEAVFDAGWADLNQRVSRVETVQARAHDAILEIIDTIVSALARDPDLATLLLFEARRVRGERPRICVSAGLVAFAEAVRGVVRQGQASGELDPALDTTAATTAILGAAEAMVRERLIARSHASRAFAEAEIRRTLDAMLSGLARRPRAARGATTLRRRRANVRSTRTARR